MSTHEADSYTLYLETLVVTLLNERPDVLADIVSTDPEAPPYAKGFSFSPYVVMERIETERAKRKDGAA